MLRSRKVRFEDEKDVLAEEVEEYEEELEVDGELEGTLGERIALPKEDEYVRKLQDPLLPSKEQVDLHYVKGHIPFRSWCHVCGEAMGKELDHRRDEGNARNLPEYSWDYCFPGDELGFKWTVMVGKERRTGMCMASAVPTKGFTTGQFTVDKCLEFVEEVVDKERDILVKSDQ